VTTLNLHTRVSKTGRKGEVGRKEGVLRRSLKNGITPAITKAKIQTPAMTVHHIAQPVKVLEYRCFEFRRMRKKRKRPTTEAYNTPNIIIVGIAKEYAIFL
jgi:hypothetical protein